MSEMQQNVASYALEGVCGVNVSAPQILHGFQAQLQNAYVDTWRNMTGQEIGISSAF